ncbi:hypothetical protein RFZ54_16810, partial [Serratia marcescens]
LNLALRPDKPNRLRSLSTLIIAALSIVQPLDQRPAEGAFHAHQIGIIRINIRKIYIFDHL